MLEDIAEPAYRIDSMLTQLLRTGWFDGVAGIVLGSWTDCGPARWRRWSSGWPRSAYRWCPGCRSATRVPQLTVPLGVAAELDADAGSLVLKQPALR